MCAVMGRKVDPPKVICHSSHPLPMSYIHTYSFEDKTLLICTSMMIKVVLLLVLRVGQPTVMEVEAMETLQRRRKVPRVPRLARALLLLLLRRRLPPPPPPPHPIHRQLSLHPPPVRRRKRRRPPPKPRHHPPAVPNQQRPPPMLLLRQTGVLLRRRLLLLPQRPLLPVVGIHGPVPTTTTPRPVVVVMRLLHRGLVQVFCTARPGLMIAMTEEETTGVLPHPSSPRGTSPLPHCPMPPAVAVAVAPTKTTVKTTTMTVPATRLPANRPPLLPLTRPRPHATRKMIFSIAFRAMHWTVSKDWIIVCVDRGNVPSIRKRLVPWHSNLPIIIAAVAVVEVVVATVEDEAEDAMVVVVDEAAVDVGVVVTTAVETDGAGAVVGVEAGDVAEDAADQLRRTTRRPNLPRPLQPPPRLRRKIENQPHQSGLCSRALKRSADG